MVLIYYNRRILSNQLACHSPELCVGLSGDTITSTYDPVHDPRVTLPLSKQMGSILFRAPRGGKTAQIISFQIFTMTQSQETLLIVGSLSSLSPPAWEWSHHTSCRRKWVYSRGCKMVLKSQSTSRCVCLDGSSIFSGGSRKRCHLDGLMSSRWC